MSGGVIRFKPMNVGRYVTWGLFALLLLVAPLVFRQSFAVTMLSQMGIWIIFALSYNMLLGQTGLLSFGHAVYAGIGAYFAMHALNMMSAGSLPFPVTLLPLIGGAFGLLFGVIFGYVTTRKAGVAFSMITLGIGEMVFAASLMFPSFFGGEGGISGNRVVGKPFLGISFGPGIQVYYLIALWTFISMIAMFALTRTPLGRIANAVRDNPERAEFVGYNTHMVRFLMFALSGFFAGIAGALATINYEIVAAESVGAQRSGGVLLAAYIGGVGFFFGPVIGAIIFTLFVVYVATLTKAWLLYLGLFFMAMVMFAPGGLASIVLMNLQVAKAGLLKRLWKPYGWLAATALLAFLGFVAIVEMTYHLSDAGGGTMSLFGLTFEVKSALPWVVAAAVLAVGGFLYRLAWNRFRGEWDDIQRIIQGGAV